MSLCQNTSSLDDRGQMNMYRFDLLKRYHFLLGSKLAHKQGCSDPGEGGEQ